MSSSINASLTAGVVMTSDTSGDLNLQSGGTTRLAVTSTGVAVTGTLSSTSGALNGSLGATTPSTIAATTISASGLVTGASFQATGNAISVIGDSLEGFVSASQSFVGSINRTSGNYLPMINTGSTHTWRVGVTTGGGITYSSVMNANGGVQVPNTVGVGNATPSTSGAGITFPATQSASSDANTLDDYEEGTFTPTITTTGTAFSNSSSGSGRYTKIGRMVTIWGDVNLIGATSGGTGNVKMGGLPFAIASTGASVGGWLPGRVTLSSNLDYSFYANASSSLCSIHYTVSGANPVELPASALNGNSSPYWTFSITYQVA